VQQRNPNNAQGIDCSHFQGVIDWNQVKGAGKSFAILKASEGHTLVDSAVYDNYNGAKAAGLAVGLYHFLRATNTDEAVKEAEFFCSIFDACGGLLGQDIPPTLDVEEVLSKDSATMCAIARAWLDTVEKKYGVRPMVYSYPNFIDFNLGDGLKDYPLWYANYGDTLADDRGGWEAWKFLQYTDSGKVPGIGGAVDLNEYAGEASELLYRMSQDDANKIITFLAAAHGMATTDQDKAEFHRLANELRKVSGQQMQ
jgi:lysozyme